jgi:hypothetical protein
MGVMFIQSGNTINASEARDRLIKALNKQKTGQKIETVPLNMTSIADAENEGARTGCRMVLVTVLRDVRHTEMKTGASPYGVATPTIQTTVTVEYSLWGVGDSTSLASKSLSSQLASSAQEIINQQMSDVAKEVLKALKKLGG